MDLQLNESILDFASIVGSISSWPRFVRQVYRERKPNPTYYVDAMTELSSIDIHTHFVPSSFPAYAGKRAGARWPDMVPAQNCGHRHVILSGEIYRTVSDLCWDGTKRNAAMDVQRVATQVLSPMPELLSYWLDSEDGAALCRHINEDIASVVHSVPERFLGLGSVPLQDVDAAISELHHVMDSLRLSGVEIGSNVNGLPLGHPTLEPFFAAAAEKGAAIFVHPLRPSGLERLVGHKSLEQLVAFPGETGLAAASMLTGGTLLRHPKLRIAFSHGGGTLPALLPRLEHGWNRFNEVRDTMPVSPAALARTMFYDSLVYDEAALRRLISCYGETQICLGSDFPFRISETDPVGFIEKVVGEDPRLRDLLLTDNAKRWLGIDEMQFKKH